MDVYTEFLSDDRLYNNPLPSHFYSKNRKLGYP